MVLVSFLGGRSRLERELDLTVNQGKAERVTVLKEPFKSLKGEVKR